MVNTFSVDFLEDFLMFALVVNVVLAIVVHMVVSINRHMDFRRSDRSDKSGDPGIKR